MSRPKSSVRFPCESIRFRRSLRRARPVTETDIEVWQAWEELKASSAETAELLEQIEETRRRMECEESF